MIVAQAIVSGRVTASGHDRAIVSGQVGLGIFGGGGNGGSTKRRLHRIDLSDGSVTAIGPELSYGITALAFDHDGTLWAVESTGGALTGQTLHRLDPRLGSIIETIGVLEDPSATEMWAPALAVHPITGVLYATGFDAATGAAQVGIYSLDTSTGVMTQVVDQILTSTGGPIGFTPDGTCYQSEEDGGAGSPVLRTVNLSTGAEATVGTLTEWMRALEWHPGRGRFLATDGGSGPNLYWVDPSDASSTVIGAPSQAIAGLAIQGVRSTAVVSGTVDTTLVDSFNSTVVAYGVTVLLEGVDVSADLVGAVQISDGIKSPFLRATFTLEGSSYSPFSTESTWTRAGDVTIRWQQGQPGDVQETTELVGIVETCKSAGPRQWAISVVDRSYLYATTPVCLEIQPLSGFDRGTIAGSMCQAAGMSSADYDFPPGATYTKAVQANGETLFRLLQAFGAPEDWHYRRRQSDNVLEAYVPRIKRPPEPADHVWEVDDLLELPSVTPPDSVPSDWIVRGTSAVSVDEVGQETTETVTEVSGAYSPRVATQEQDSSGTITSTGFSPSDQTTRVVFRLTSRVTKRGDKIVRQVDVEEGWKNPRFAKYMTGSASLGSGSAPNGYYFAESYLDSDGEYVTWTAERFVEVGRRIQDFTYDDDGNLTRLDVSTYRYFTKRAGIRAGNSPKPYTTTPSVVNVPIGSDDVSYDSQSGASLGAPIEYFGLAEKQVLTYTYDETTGALVQQEQATYSYGHIPSRIDDGGGYWVNADGTGQTELVSSWKQTGLLRRTTIVDADGRISGEIDTEWGYHVVELPPDTPGVNDWGAFGSYKSAAPFTILPEGRTVREITVDSADSYLEVTYTSDGETTHRDERRVLGQPPIPTYLASAWTRLVQEPLEVTWGSDVLEAWFGPETHVLNNPYIQTTSEAFVVLDRARSERASHEVVVTRPDNWARPGDTVQLIDRERSISHRFILTSRTRIRDLSAPSAIARYTLEAPFL